VIAPFEYRALWVKSVNFINKALDPELGPDEQGFWASSALELLGKATLAKIHPTLIADIRNNDRDRGGDSLLAAAGAIRSSGDFVSIAATTVYSRCARVVQGFDAGRAGLVARDRNAYVHSASAIRVDDTWWDRFWPLVSLLLASQERHLEEYVGVDRREEIESVLARANKHAQQRLTTLIKVAKERHERLQRGEATERERADIGTRTRVMASYAESHRCPACGGQGWIYGDQTLDSDYIGSTTPSGDYVGFIREVATDGFACGDCGLVLSDKSLVEHANMPLEFEIEDDESDYLEPEYGND
jgi:hypothetical protein